MRRYLFLVLICLSPILVKAQVPTDTTNVPDIDTTGQRDLIDIGTKLFKFRPRRYPNKDKKQVYYSVLPISTAVPGGSNVLVTSTTAGFFLGPRKTTYLSSVTFAPYFNFKGRYGLPIHSSIWTKDNTFNIQGDTRFLVYPQDTWGLGGGHPENDRVLLNYDYLRFYQSALKRISPYFYAGIGYNMDYYFDFNPTVNNQTVSLANFTNYAYGTTANQKSFTSGLSLNLLYDTRQNSLNPIPGVYGNVIYRFNTEVLGSDNNSRSLYLDFRKYVSLTEAGPKNQLAFWSYYWTTLSTGTPYLNLPSIGMDPYQRSGRGIEQSRYRGESLLYFETEYRRDITNNGLLGFVLFANVNSASQANTRKFEYLNPAGGAGLRIKFNKKSNTNICLDYGFSKGYSDLNIALGEAF
jgi:Omp85 superfamily domain